MVASNASGSSDASAEVSQVPVDVASAPGSVTAKPGSGDISVSWSQPTSDGGSQVTGYDVFVATTAGGEDLAGTTACSTTGTTSCDVTGLQNGQTYYIEVVAANAAGSSLASAEVSATPSTVPDAPTGATVTDNGSGGADISWSAPGFNGGSALTGYEVFAATTKGGENLAGTPACSATGTGCSVSGLVAGTSYYFVVVATNVNGVSAASSEVGITTAPPAGAVTNLSAKGGDGTAQVSWQAPAGGSVTTYSLYVSTTQPVATTGTPAYTGTGTGYTVTGLHNGTTYYIVVVTAGADGTTATSSTVSVVPTAPSTATKTPPATSKPVKTTPAHVSLGAGKNSTTVTEVGKQLKAGAKLTVKISEPGHAKPIVRSSTVKGNHTYQYKTGKLPVGTTTIRFYEKSGKKLKLVRTEKVTVKAAHKKSRLANSISRKADVQ